MEELLDNQSTDTTSTKECDGTCPMPLVEEEEATPISKGDLVIFTRNGKVRTGRVVSLGSKNIGLSVYDMKSNTKIPANSELVPVTVFVEAEVLA